MKGTAKRKVVTSGRLTGGVRVQPARRRVTPNPGPAACPEPAYSLYSTDSEDQVTNLHKGLDRCAALLSGILQAENTEPKPSPLRAVKGGAAKSRSSTSLGKKTSKKPPTKTDQKSSQSVHRGPGSTTPRSPHVFSSPAAHSGVTLHPPKKHTHTLLQSPVSPSQNQARQLPYLTPSQPQPSICPPQPQPSILLSVSQSNSLLQSPSHPDQPPLSHTDCQSAPHTLSHSVRTDRSCSSCDREQEESVPVRDTNTQSSGTDPHTGVRDPHTHIHTCTMKMSKLQLEAGQADTFPQDTHSGEDSSAETEVKQRTVQYLLGELKALIAGQGSVAERLLSHLEQTVSSPLMNVSSSNSPAESAADLQSLHIQNSQLRRRVRILNQQLKEREKAERQQNMETLCDSQVSTLQEELTSAQSRLQELQDDLAELRKALQDTQSQLRDREAENALMKTDLEATRCRLLHSEREKSELASLVQQRLEEIENLNRILQRRHDSSASDASPTKQHCNQHQHRQDPPEPPTDRITQYLMSLDQLEPTHADRNACVAAEREGNAADEKKLRETSTHPDVRSHRLSSDEVQSYGRQMGTERRRLFDSTLSQSDVESVTSEWSMRSSSTFDTRDEAAFRDGLAALDASIASLQKTIKLDLGR